MVSLGLSLSVLFTSVLYNLGSVNGEILVNCGSGAVIGQPYHLECTNIPTNVTKGMNVFIEGKFNSIIVCVRSKNCLARNPSLYIVESPHNESLYFTILNVTKEDIQKDLYCVDNENLGVSASSCKLKLFTTTTVPPSTTMDVHVPDGNNDGLTGGEIAGIVIAVIVICSSCIICIVCVVWKKKKGKKERRQN